MDIKSTDIIVLGDTKVCLTRKSTTKFVIEWMDDLIDEDELQVLLDRLDIIIKDT